MRAERKPAPGLWNALRATSLPIGEALHPIALAAVIVLLVNDWWGKRSAAPAWLTGKLSDLAGLTFAPLVLSALIGLGLFALGRDGSITRRRLVAVIGATAAVFAAVKLSPDAARAIAAVWPGARARIVADPTDLLCLPVLAVPWAIGRAQIAYSLGRRSTSRGPSAS